jgi:hypothetical protein
MTSALSVPLQEQLIHFCRRLVDQQKARVIVTPQAPEPGFWFGGGNMVSAPDGSLYLVGRYRNAGDSRTGVAAGTRGLELAIFRSQDQGKSFHKVLQFSKQDLNVPGRPVVSIEGSALRWTADGVELFVSTEKDGVGYPAGYESYLKPGTGVWSIDRLQAATIEGLKSAAVEPLLECHDPRYIHVKDPFLYESKTGPTLLFCSHPFSWTSSNTGYLPLSKPVDPTRAVYEFFSRGVTWDVAMSRGTCLLDVPRVGKFGDQQVGLLFYDGGECVRNLDEHAQAVKRPRGYSCEELGGAACFLNGEWTRLERLSKYEPLFVSPTGTGCSRYVNVLSRPEGMYVTWQQSQADGSQPLVMNFVSREEIEAALC